MNRAHLDFLASPDWKRMLEADLVPWMDGSGDLGDDVLEVGGGPGLTHEDDTFQPLDPATLPLRARKA